MTHCEEQLFSYADLTFVAPWLSEEACRELSAAGLFTPRIFYTTDDDSRCMNVSDLIALTATQQALRCGISADQLRQALYTPASFRCDDFSEEDLIFLSTGALHGQQLSRFLEITNADVTILVRVPLVGDSEIEIIPNGLLGPKDYRGVSLTGVECKAIRDRITANITASVLPA
jgi:hypothetical protein